MIARFERRRGACGARALPAPCLITAGRAALAPRSPTGEDGRTRRGCAHTAAAMLATLLACAPVSPAHAEAPRSERRTVGAAQVDERVDQAIERGLVFLAAGQTPEGSFDSYAGRTYTAIPGLCGLAFLAKGYLPGHGKYGENIERASTFILSRAAADGYLGGNEGRMYSHSIATLFLAEVSGMVNTNLQAKIDDVLPKAVQVIISAQRVPKIERYAGGWRYGPASIDSDMSCTGWALMALRSARLTGAAVPASAIKDAVQYVLRHHSEQKGSFGYMDTSSHGVTLTGAGLLCLELCGQHGHPATRRATRYLMNVYEQLPQQGYCFYGLYYTAQGLFQVGGEEWQRFSKWMYDYWIPRQAPDGRWNRGEVNCPYYQTAMVVLAFAVPYRQLPIYQRDETVDGE